MSSSKVIKLDGVLCSYQLLVVNLDEMNKTKIFHSKQIGLADRTLMPGNVVRRIGPGKDTQKGYCRHVFVSADVRIKGTSFILKNISSDRLRPLDSFVEDDVVCLDSWVGSTKRIEEKLVLK